MILLKRGEETTLRYPERNLGPCRYIYRIQRQIDIIRILNHLLISFEEKLYHTSNSI